MLTPDYFYGKSDKLIEMYQELEDWIMEDAAVEFILAKKPILLHRTAEYEQLKLFS